MKYSDAEKQCIRIVAKWFRENRDFVGRDDAIKELGVDDITYDTLIKMMEHIGVVKGIKSVMGSNGYAVLFRPSAYAEQLAREIDAQSEQEAVKASNELKVANSITIEDVNKLLELFQQLEKMIEPSLPPRNDKLWREAKDEAQKELIDQLKERGSTFSERPGLWTSPKRPNKIEQAKIQKQAEERILVIAEKKYCEKDSVYAEALDTAQKATAEVLKKIAHLLECVRNPLQQFSPAKSTWLVTDFRKIRRYYENMPKDYIKHSIQEAIEALQGLKVMFERQEQLEAQKRDKVTPASEPGSILGDTWTIGGIPINAKKLFKSHPVIFCVILLVIIFFAVDKFSGHFFVKKFNNKIISPLIHVVKVATQDIKICFAATETSELSIIGAKNESIKDFKLNLIHKNKGKNTMYNADLKLFYSPNLSISVRTGKSSTVSHYSTLRSGEIVTITGLGDIYPRKEDISLDNSLNTFTISIKIRKPFYFSDTIRRVDIVYQIVAEDYFGEPMNLCIKIGTNEAFKNYRGRIFKIEDNELVEYQK